MLFYMVCKAVEALWLSASCQPLYTEILTILGSGTGKSHTNFHDSSASNRVCPVNNNYTASLCLTDETRHDMHLDISI